MDGWHVALYAFAIYLAVRTLVGLMKAHELDLRRRLATEAAAEQQAATEQKAAAEVPVERRAG